MRCSSQRGQTEAYTKRKKYFLFSGRVGSAEGRRAGTAGGWEAGWGGEEAVGESLSLQMLLVWMLVLHRVALRFAGGNKVPLLRDR